MRPRHAPIDMSTLMGTNQIEPVFLYIFNGYWRRGWDSNPRYGLPDVPVITAYWLGLLAVLAAHSITARKFAFLAGCSSAAPIPRHSSVDPR